MRSVVSKWVLPGIITIIVGTIAAVVLSQGNIEKDLTARTSKALQDAGYIWAKVTFSGRDASVAGTSTNPKAVPAVTNLVAKVHGVRSVNSKITVAPTVSPYPFSARLSNGKIALSGGVPDVATRTALATQSGVSGTGLKLLSGVPKGDWRAATSFALAQLKFLDKGEASLSDLTLSVNGRAKSGKDYNTITTSLAGNLPAGLVAGKINISPPVVSPYVWNAKFDGQSINISGFSPNDAATKLIRAASPTTIKVNIELKPGSGAPRGFGDRAALLIKNLAALASGSAEITDDSARLSGTPHDFDSAASITKTLREAGVDVNLKPPFIKNFWFAAQRNNGITKLTGFAPDRATRTKYGELADSSGDALLVAQGAPDGYDAGVIYGLSMLNHMSNGKMRINGNQLDVQGTADTSGDFVALTSIISDGPPQNVTIVEVKVFPPLADPYTWSVNKRSDKTITLDGFVPSDSARTSLLAGLQGNVTNYMRLASGAPADFMEHAKAGLAALNNLESGTIEYSGAVWFLSGQPANQAKLAAANAALSQSNNWQTNISEPSQPIQVPGGPEKMPAAVVINQPKAEPAATSPSSPANLNSISTSSTTSTTPGANFSFVAKLSLDSGIVVTGDVPDIATKSYLGIVAGRVATAFLVVVPNAPDGFARSARNGLRALRKLEEGRLAFEDGVWSLSGKAANSKARAIALANINDLADEANWKTRITIAGKE